jgi:isopenicillin N synthase-like dioxygenase
MSELMSLLLGRGKELMGMPLGYSQEAQDKMFGLGFENVRAQEKPAREQLLNTLSRQGMSGTGTAAGQLSDLSWSAEKNITDLARQLFVGNEDKKKADLLDYTGAASNILGSGVSYENIQEAMNAARRGEGNTALMLLLQALGIYK